MVETNNLLLPGLAIILAPLIIALILTLFLVALSSKQSLLNRFEWYWTDFSSRGRALIFLTSCIATMLFFYSTWRVWRLWIIHPPILGGNWQLFTTLYWPYAVTTTIIFIVALTLFLPGFWMLGQKIFLWKLKYKRAKLGDPETLELSEQAIFRRSVVDTAARYGLEVTSKTNSIKPSAKNTTKYAPITVKANTSTAYGFAAKVRRFTHASSQKNPDWENKDLMIIPQSPGNARALIVAESGAGKTELINSVIAAHIAQRNPVCFIDGKGDSEDADFLKNHLGAHVHNTGYNFFAGSHDDIVERLKKLIPTAESTTFYTDEAHGVIAHIISQWPPTTCQTLEEFKLRWDYVVIREREDVAAGITQPYLTEKVQGQQRARRVWDSLQTRFGQVAAFHAAHGWTIDEFFTIGGLHVVPIVAEDEADTLLANLLLHDYRRYLVQRKRDKITTPGVMIIDEFTQIVREELSSMPAPKIAASLFETSRSLNMGLYIAGQSLSAMAETEEMQKRLIQGGAALIVGRGKDSEIEAKAFGTVIQAESSADAKGSEAQSTRAQHAYRVSPEWIRGLANGVFFFAQKGTYRSFVVLPINRHNPTTID